MQLATHSGRLERWLGKEAVERTVDQMKGWYGSPIAISGVPGQVFVDKHGDFRGEIREGFEMSAKDRAYEIMKRLRRGARVASGKQRAQLHAGFTSLADFIAESKIKTQTSCFNKTALTGAVGVTQTLWSAGALPVAGGVGSAAPAGAALSRTTTGALGFVNPTVAGDQTYLASTRMTATNNGMNILIYDRLFHVAKTMSSTATEAVTGVPTRYQSNTQTADDYSGNNFLFMETTTTLGATAHNWTVCTYTDQDGNTAVTLPTVTGVSTQSASRLDHTGWFCPLADGDHGIKALTQMQCSASVTGAITFVIGHPLAWQVCVLANVVTVIDHISTAFNLVRVFDNACISFLNPFPSTTSGTSYVGQLRFVSS